MGALDSLIAFVVDLRDRVRALEQQETPFEAGLLPPSAGGTGVDNGSFTLTLNASVTLSSSPAPSTAKYIVQTADAGLSNEQALGSLATGLLKNTTTTGVLSIATAADLPDHASNHAAAGADPITIAASQIGSGTIATARLGSGTATAATLLFGDNTWATLVAGDLPTHTHAAGDITTGTIATARLGSGAASASTLLFGDNTWATLVAGDIPNLDASKITSGTFGVARLGSGSGSTSNFLRGDGSWTDTLATGINIGSISGASTGQVFASHSIKTGSTNPTFAFGNYTASADAAVSGYVTVSVGGTNRKFAIIT